MNKQSARLLHCKTCPLNRIVDKCKSKMAVLSRNKLTIDDYEEAKRLQANVNNRGLFFLQSFQFHFVINANKHYIIWSTKYYKI